MNDSVTKIQKLKFNKCIFLYTTRKNEKTRNLI